MIRVICFFILLAVISSTAVASETDWSIIFRASSSSFDGFGPLALCGTRTSSIDGLDSNDKSYTAGTGSQARVAVYKAAWPGNPPLYSQDHRALLNPDLDRKDSCGCWGEAWELRVWVEPEYTFDTLRLAIWSTPSLTTPESACGIPTAYGLTVVDDLTGTYSTDSRWFLNSGLIGTSTEPYMYIDFRNLGAIRLADSDVPSRAIKLRFGAGCLEVATGEFPDPVPEPGSFVVLGSGLIGFGGYIFRKRK